MYICCVCSKQLVSVSQLICHLQILHAHNYDVFTCKQNQCFQSFSTIQTFKRHLIQSHQHIETTNIEVQNEIQFDISTATTSFSETVQSKESDTKGFSFNRGSIHECKQIIAESGVKFAIKLHSFDNFTRKDDLTIQNLISETILNSLSKALGILKIG